MPTFAFVVEFITAITTQLATAFVMPKLAFSVDTVLVSTVQLPFVTLSTFA